MGKFPGWEWIPSGMGAEHEAACTSMALRRRQGVPRSLPARPPAWAFSELRRALGARTPAAPGSANTEIVSVNGKRLGEI